MKKTVLLVDDDPDVLNLLTLRIEKSGRYSVVVARGCRDGLSKARSVSPYLIVCDVDMPDLDGGSLAAALSAERSTASIPILLLSAMVEEKQAAMGAIGGWPMPSKGASTQRMIARIGEMFSVAPGGP